MEKKKKIATEYKHYDSMKIREINCFYQQKARSKFTPKRFVSYKDQNDNKIAIFLKILTFITT